MLGKPWLKTETNTTEPAVFYEKSLGSIFKLDTQKCLCRLISMLQHPVLRDTHTLTNSQKHSSGVTSFFGLGTKHGINCTVDFFTAKSSDSSNICYLCWYGYKVDLLRVPVCGDVCVCAALLSMHLIQLMHLCVCVCGGWSVCVWMQAFLTSSGYDPYDPFSVMQTWHA